MFGSLIVKECKMWLKSVLFYAYVIILFIFYVSQMGTEILTKPEPGLDDYGQIRTDDKEIIMENALKQLIMEYDYNSFATYPVGFFKEVIPTEKEREEISSYLTRLTGMEEQESEDAEWPFHVSEDITYKEFEEIMEKISGMLGGGSNYSMDNIRQTSVPMTYEQAVEEYEEACEKEHITGTYARLFSDYMGILLGILPAFFGISRVIKDKRSQAQPVFFTKRASSLTIVLSRYAGMLVMLFVPVLAVSCFSLMQSSYIARTQYVVPDYLAYVKYCVVWLLPTILFVSVLAYLITELTENIFAVLVSGGIWYGSLFLGLSTSLEHAGWNLIPRFNELGGYQNFTRMVPQLVKNRIAYTLASLVLLILVVLVYEWKRKGGGIHGKIFENRKRQFKA